MIPPDPFNRTRLPADLEAELEHRRNSEAARAEHVVFLGEVSEALLRGELPPRPAALFVGQRLRVFLEEGGDLLAHLLLRPRRGSKLTASALWSRMRDRDHPDEDVGALSE